MTPPGRGRGHSADDVARAALRILDDDGLADLTMRRLATRLDVQPSALYWHFPNKQSLLAELSDRIVAQAASLLRGSGVAAEARALRDALLAYRDGAEVVSSTLALGLGSTAARDRLTAAVAAEGFAHDVAARAATTLLHFVLGHVWHEQQRLQYDSVGVVTPGVAHPPEADFLFGVDLIHRGLHATAPRPA
ncbi:TetR family transcriptional regulator [Microbacterium mcarthurae (nom. nud.)]|uniref:TetR family transcriptional regulator n=1 Tax=Microbacterium mcarthurae TaxID=3035918 RepID=A0ABW9GFZ0_9MICO